MSTRAPGTSADDAGVAPHSAALDDEAEVLRRLVEGTARSTGAAFFRSLVRNLSLAVGSPYCFIAEFATTTHLRTLAFWARGRCSTTSNIRSPAPPAKPCCAADWSATHVAPDSGFPRIAGCKSWTWRVISACRSSTAAARPRTPGSARYPPDDRGPAARVDFPDLCRPRRPRARTHARGGAAAHLGAAFPGSLRRGADRHIYEDTESRFVSANRAAMKLLGLQPHEVRGTLGLSLVAPTPESQERVHRAIEAIQKGEERACIELELRRKMTPIGLGAVVVQAGTGRQSSRARCSFDITDRVLAEQERNRLHQQNLYLQEELKASTTSRKLSAPRHRCETSWASEAGGSDRFHRVDPRRDRHGEGALCARHPQSLQTPAQAR